MKPLKAQPQTGPDPAPPSDGRIEPYIAISIVFHGVLFIAFAVRAFFVSQDTLPLENSIRVDMVALPDRPKAKLPPIEQPKPEAKPVKEEPKPEPAKTEPVKPVMPKNEAPKVDLKKNKHEQEAALRRLEALDRLKRMSEPAKSESTKAAPEPPPIKGNEVSKGNSLTGLQRLENESYVETVHNHVTSHWNLPQFLAGANLSAKIRIYVDGNGNLLKKDLVRSSGNPVFDESAMKAIDASIPLPHPPSDLVNLVSVRGIDIDFIPER